MFSTVVPATSGAVVSTTALSANGADSLPTASLIETTTSKVSPSFGASTLTVISPAVMSSVVNTVSSPLTITLSPATASAGKSTLTSTLSSASISAAEIHSSPLPITTESGALGASFVLPVPLSESFSELCPAQAKIPPAVNGTAAQAHGDTASLSPYNKGPTSFSSA
ncbi:hypothetical protein Asch01_03289 [Acinetobacter schindleri]